MRTSHIHTLLGCFLCVAVTSGTFSLVVAPSAAADTKQVLTLYSTGAESPMATAGNRELPRLLKQGLAGDLVYFSEFIDQGRFPDPAYQEAFSAFLRVKYRQQRIDLIIAIQAAAVSFVGTRRDELFPDTPVVFLALASPPQRLANSTAVFADLDLASTIALALELQPETRHVFVVSGAGAPDKEYERLARTQLKPFEGRLAITYLAGLPTKELEARLATLPEDSIIYYLVVYQDGAGEAFSPGLYGQRVAAVGRAPTYTWSDAMMEFGILGGSLLDRGAMMEAAGKVALRVLHGEPADSIPASSPNLNVRQVDWRQLRRWGMSERRVPPGTLIRFREPSAWDRYKFYAFGAAAIVLAQSALIAGLLIQRRRRQQAEERVQGSQAELRDSYERIRDLGSRLLNAQDLERSRIARELHDDVSQQVALLNIDLELLRASVASDAEDLAGEVVNRAQSIGRSVHALSHRLHPAKLRLIGLVAALQALQRELSHADIAIRFTYDKVPPALPPELTLSLFRIVQEALQNALKYSKARQVSVHLQDESEGLTLTIEDDGVGFDVAAEWGKGLGLISMSERLEAIGGTLAIRSTPGAGTRLEVKVPLSMPPDAETHTTSDHASGANERQRASQ
jgi:signal transduction histidine kinase